MVHLVWLFMKMYLLALLQDNCLHLVHSAFLCNLSAYVRNITACSQHQLRPILSAILADTNISVKPKYWPIYRPGLKLKSWLHNCPNRVECCSNKKTIPIFSVVKSVYSALFHSYLTYSIVNSGRANTTNLPPLIRLQNKAVRTLEYDKSQTAALYSKHKF